MSVCQTLTWTHLMETGKRQHPEAKAEGYDWPQVRWECSCGAVGRWGSEKRLMANWQKHVNLAGGNEQVATDEKGDAE